MAFFVSAFFSSVLGVSAGAPALSCASTASVISFSLLEYRIMGVLLAVSAVVSNTNAYPAAFALPLTVVRISSTMLSRMRLFCSSMVVVAWRSYCLIASSESLICLNLSSADFLRLSRSSSERVWLLASVSNVW